MKIKCFFEINKIKLLDVWEGSDLRALYYILLVLTLYLLLLVLTVLRETYKVREGFKNSSSIDKWNRPLIFAPPTH